MLELLVKILVVLQLFFLITIHMSPISRLKIKFLCYLPDCFPLKKDVILKRQILDKPYTMAWSAYNVGNVDMGTTIINGNTVITYLSKFITNYQLISITMIKILRKVMLKIKFTSFNERVLNFNLA